MPNSKIIFGFVSEIGSGKGEAAKYLKEKYNAAVFRYSDFMRDILGVLFLEHSRENLQSVATGLRKTFGENIFGGAMLKKIESSESNLIVIDGIRRRGDLDGLKILNNFNLVAINVLAEERYKRITLRSENSDDKTKTWEEFQKQLQAETEVEIIDIMKEAKFTIDNSGTVDDFHKKLDELVIKINK